ncbi:MAG: META domain-containing protein [Solirubrobacteraceae bacterium]|nr:META domain-containing protein [Solirubrobacteraceae bacterium]
MGCADKPDAWINGLLEGPGGQVVQSDDGKTVKLSRGGRSATFGLMGVRGGPAPLEGPQWRAVWLLGAQQGSLVDIEGPAVKPGFRIEGDRATIFTGCNSGTAPATVGLRAVSFGAFTPTTTAPCDGPAADVDRIVRATFTGRVAFSFGNVHSVTLAKRPGVGLSFVVDGCRCPPATETRLPSGRRRSACLQELLARAALGSVPFVVCDARHASGVRLPSHSCTIELAVPRNPPARRQPGALHRPSRKPRGRARACVGGRRRAEDGDRHRPPDGYPLRRQAPRRLGRRAEPLLHRRAEVAVLRLAELPAGERSGFVRCGDARRLRRLERLRLHPAEPPECQRHEARARRRYALRLLRRLHAHAQRRPRDHPLAGQARRVPPPGNPALPRRARDARRPGHQHARRRRRHERHRDRPAFRLRRHARLGADLQHGPRRVRGRRLARRQLPGRQPDRRRLRPHPQPHRAVVPQPRRELWQRDLQPQPHARRDRRAGGPGAAVLRRRTRQVPRAAHAQPRRLRSHPHHRRARPARGVRRG